MHAWRRGRGHRAVAHSERAVRARDDPAKVRLPHVDRDGDALASPEVRFREDERLRVGKAQDRREAHRCGG